MNYTEFKENKSQNFSKQNLLNFYFDSDKKILCKKKSTKKTNLKNKVDFKTQSVINKKFSKTKILNLEKTVNFSKKIVQIENKSPSKKLISTKLKKAKEHIKTPYHNNFKKIIKNIEKIKSVELFKKDKTNYKMKNKNLIDKFYSERKNNENILNVRSKSI
jgi:hypothetical protein